MKIKHLFILASFSLLLFACEKQIVPPQAATPQDSRMTLADMAGQVAHPGDRAFLTTTTVTDLDKAFERAMERKAAALRWPKIKIKKKWYSRWTTCDNLKGWCVILSFNLRTTDPDIVEVEALAANGTLTVAFPAGVSGDFGLTQDGFLPIGANLPIPNDVLTDLGISNPNTEVAAGIYAAHWDAAEGRYTGVTVNLHTW